MSSWTTIDGHIRVGWAKKAYRDSEMRNALEVAVRNLPVVEGSENDMNIYFVPTTGISHGVDESIPGSKINSVPHDSYARRDDDSEYLVVVYGDLRDTTFQETLRSFTKWLVRFGKNFYVKDILVRVRLGWGGFDAKRYEREFGYPCHIFDDSHWLHELFDLDIHTRLDDLLPDPKNGR